jgi:hypothetical protein
MSFTALCLSIHALSVKREVSFHDDFEAEFDALDEGCRTKLLEQFGARRVS